MTPRPNRLQRQCTLPLKFRTFLVVTELRKYVVRCFRLLPFRFGLFLRVTSLLRLTFTLVRFRPMAL